MKNFKIKIPPKNIKRLKKFIKFSDSTEDIVSAMWNKFSKNSQFGLDENHFILSPELFESRKRLGFTSSILQSYGFKNDKGIFERFKQYYKNLINSIKNSFYTEESKAMRQYEYLWDNIEGALSCKDIKNQNKYLTWDIIKSYNYYNELSPIINLLNKPKFYLEIGSGMCYLASIIKKNFGL